MESLNQRKAQPGILGTKMSIDTLESTLCRENEIVLCFFSRVFHFRKIAFSS